MAHSEFPIRDNNSEIAELAELEFSNAILNAGHFIIQQQDRHDYGTDYQIEAKQSGMMTNCRVHVQLKSTQKKLNKDGSLSISVEITNLNYLLSQPSSVYVCYHVPSKTLLVRSAEDIKQSLNIDRKSRSRNSISIRFNLVLDGVYQEKLCNKIYAYTCLKRDERSNWLSIPPADLTREISINVPIIDVAESPDNAFAQLKSLYDQKQDAIISKSFDQFIAVLGQKDPRRIYAYLSEINLAMRKQPCDRRRISDAISLLMGMPAQSTIDRMYCMANARSALGQSQEAKRLYREAIDMAGPNDTKTVAQCWKNLGSECEHAGDHSYALICYKNAVALMPDLMEAHFALAMSYKYDGDLVRSLEHYDRVVWSVDDFEPTAAARGHRLEVYCLLDKRDEFFADISVLLPHSNRMQWIMDYCAWLVYRFVRANSDAELQAIKFWDAYLRLRPSDERALAERNRLVEQDVKSDNVPDRKGIANDSSANSLEAYIAKINSGYFLREFTYSASRFTGLDGQERELCDGAIWIGELLILYQLKERNLKDATNSGEIESKWFAKKVSKKAVDQLNQTLSYLNAESKLPLFNLRKQEIDITKATPRVVHKVVLYKSSKNLPLKDVYNKGRVSSRIGFVHFIHVDDYVNVCATLHTPAEISDYLSYRAEASSKNSHACELPEKALVGKYLSDTGVDGLELADEHYVDRLISDRDEYDMNGVLQNYLNRISSGNEGTQYHAILAEIAKLPRNLLKLFRSRLKWAMSKCGEKDFYLPSRFSFPANDCCFIFIPLSSNEYSYYYKAAYNYTVLCKYDLRVSRAIGMAVMPHTNPGDYQIQWCYLDCVWESNAALQKELDESDLFRETKPEMLGKYRFES